MASQEELKEIRLQKLEILKSKGINPYPAVSGQDLSILELKDQFTDLADSSKEITIVGRIMSIRGQGAIFFVDLYDGSGKFQAVFKSDAGIVYKDLSIENAFDLFVETIDQGDFIEVSGKVFTTQRGEQSLAVSSWKILTKSLLPIPDNYYGLKDDDERYRKRYLDLLLNPELKEIFELKARFWESVRNFMKAKGFLEVETPYLEVTTGGAEANPFKTHHKDFDMDVYLRISVGELWQKRLMSAGFAKTFEIGRIFRNEGSSPEHLQEFTNLEFYQAFADTKSGKELVKELYQTIANDVFGKTEFSTRGHTFDLAGEWSEIDYVEKVKEITGINVLEASEKEMITKLDELGVKYIGQNKERLTDSLWKYCRKQISGPAFLINHPKLVAPLSKDLPGSEGKTDMFQVIIAGSEVGRAHAELNDPIEQAERFKNQQKLLTEGDTEAMMEDQEFLEMLDYGMPPTFGFGFGERLFAFMVDKPVREVQLFPLMRPKK